MLTDEERAGIRERVAAMPPMLPGALDRIAALVANAHERNRWGERHGNDGDGADEGHGNLVGEAV
jgi:hypothetical protein